MNSPANTSDNFRAAGIVALIAVALASLLVAIGLSSIATFTTGILALAISACLYRVVFASGASWKERAFAIVSAMLAWVAVGMLFYIVRFKQAAL
ncbi:MAG: hypothetical protein AAGA95_00940 [Pseudomonadota bacterium]